MTLEGKAPGCRKRGGWGIHGLSGKKGPKALSSWGFRGQCGSEVLLGTSLVGSELLEPWPSRTWDQSHLSGLQEKWLQNFWLRWRSPYLTHSQGWDECILSLGKMILGHLHSGTT